MKIYRIANTKSEEFKKWFGNWEDPNAFSSKRKEPSSFGVNDKGEPDTFYHGTLKDFSEFEVGKEGTNSNIFGSWKTNRWAIFFTRNPEHANTFTIQGEESTGGNIMPVYLNVKSPLDFRSGVNEDILDEFSREGINPRWLIKFNWEHFDGEDGKRFVEVAKELGYDGVIFNDEDPATHNSFETWAIFDPSQIKSVYNSGKYDSLSKNITANNFKIYRIAKAKKTLYWKHHLAQHFIEGKAPIKNNGVGAGGDVFLDFDKMADKIGKDKYWVCPVELWDDEVVFMEDNIYRSKVKKIGIGDFGPISYWEKNKNKL